MKVFLIAHNIRSAHNVGSLLRTADGAGVSKVFITGFTPAPIDRFGREDVKITKVSLGAEVSVSWEQDEIDVVLKKLRDAGVHIVALEQHPTSVPYDSLNMQGDIALLLGSEVGGIDAPLLESVDSIIEIPMRGKKDSLNVSVAAGIALFEITKYRASPGSRL